MQRAIFRHLEVKFKGASGRNVLIMELTGTKITKIVNYV